MRYSAMLDKSSRTLVPHFRVQYGSLLLQHPEVILTEYANVVDTLSTVARELGYETYDPDHSPPELLDLLASTIMAGELPWYSDGAKSRATVFQEFMNLCPRNSH